MLTKFGNSKLAALPIMISKKGDGLDTFRRIFEEFCAKSNIVRSFTADDLEDNKGFKNQLVELNITLQSLAATSYLLSVAGRETFRNNRRQFISVADSLKFEVSRLFALLNAILDRQSDVIIWDNGYAAIAQSTPPPKLTPYPFQTPQSLNTSTFVNSSEKRKYVDAVLEEELGSIYVGIHNFDDVFFCIEGLNEATAAVFQRCQEGDSPLFAADCGWQNWPESAKEREVLDWLSTWIDKIRSMASSENNALESSRTILTQPNRPLEESTAGRKLDIGIVTNSTDQEKYDWPRVLVLGKLKSNSKEDMA
ncbi:hypothetical protein ABOM_008691 [Aspergillus bombycis]|uniref:Uncharacterized protein n=1 Tax=Aspergillus bombycis TaxID=109264 RepID=A0A1F7ZV66_9EURO|nr:hypothetical protein ABOM_008691 [Aspergillus bombycis]OGM43351.1 hypothetical protein ABOM_008691 [Aspergillus bombycis]